MMPECRSDQGPGRERKHDFHPTGSDLLRGDDRHDGGGDCNHDSEVQRAGCEFLSKLRSKGYLYLDAVDVASGAVARIGYYAPSETAPCYHRYVNGCATSDDSWVAAICKIRYTPAVADSDEVIPGNAGALRAGLAAIKCENEGDTVRRDQFLADGLRMLSDEARENRGGVRFALRVDPAAFQFANLYQGR